MSENNDTNPGGIVLISIHKVYYTCVNNIPKFEVASENNRQNQFVVKIVLESGIVEIPLGSKNTEGTNNQVVNQPTWTNNEAGAIAAVNDILSWIQ